MTDQDKANAVIVIPDIGAMPWRALPPAGLYSKTLSVDPETGARTALVRMVPAEGYTPPATAHYHDTYEEILGVAGRFTFDDKVWLGRNSYVFHPAGTVHGFHSIVPEDSTFLSRVGAGHTGNAVPDPAHGEMHSIYPVPDPRAPIALGEPVATVPATFRGFLAGGPVQWHEISTAPSGAHGAAMLRLPAGWRSPASQAAATLEMFTIDAGLTFDDAAPAESSAGSYARIRMGERVPAIAAATDVTLFVTFGDI